MSRLILTLIAHTGIVLTALATTTVAHAGCSDEVGYVATFEIQPGTEAAFEEAITTLAETVRRVEDGVILYAPFKGQGNTYYMMERYENAAAREKHGTSEEVQALFPTLGPHLAGAPDVQPVSAVCGG